MVTITSSAGTASPMAARPTALLPGGIANFSAGQVRFNDGETCQLTHMEAELLRFLISNAVKPISRDVILRAVWRIDPARVYTRTVDVHIGKLRRKLRDHPRSPRIIISVHGYGYMLRL